MQCSSVGYEVWFLLAFATAGVALLVIAPRSFQRWLRERRPRSLGLSALFEKVWLMRVLGVIPILMWAVAIFGVYCFFHGADLPPPGGAG